METLAVARPFDVTHRSVFKIALPMTLAYISTPLLGLVDTAVIGQLGDPALLGGIAIGAVLYSFVFSSFNFLRSGTTGLVAQALGADKLLEINAIFLRALMIALFLGIAVISLKGLLITGGLMAMGSSDNVGQAGGLYLSILAYSAPFGLTNFVILGWFLGLGKAGTGLLLQVLLNGVNIVLNVTFVLVFHWGVAGVAWGTVIGEVVTAFVGLALVLRHAGRNQWPTWDVLTDWEQFKRIAALNGGYYDPVLCVVVRVFIFYRAKRSIQRRHVGGQFRVDALPVDLGLFFGWDRDGCRTIGRPGGRSPLETSLPTNSFHDREGRAGHIVFDVADILVLWATSHRPDHHVTGGSRRRSGLFAVGCSYADRRRHGVPDGRHLYRRDLVTDHA